MTTTWRTSRLYSKSQTARDHTARCARYVFNLGKCPRDWILTLAMAGHIEVFWCHRILDALGRHLLPKRVNQLTRSHLAEGMTPEEALALATSTASAQMTHLIDAMNQAFPAAMIADESWHAHLASCTNDQEDRHVLACAMASNSSIIITENVKDFPESSVAPYGIAVRPLDAFLARLPTPTLLEAIDVIAKRNQRPPRLAWQCSRPCMRCMGFISRTGRQLARWRAMRWSPASAPSCLVSKNERPRAQDFFCSTCSTCWAAGALWRPCALESKSKACSSRISRFKPGLANSGKK